MVPTGSRWPTTLNRSCPRLTRLLLGVALVAACHSSPPTDKPPAPPPSQAEREGWSALFMTRGDRHTIMQGRHGRLTQHPGGFNVLAIQEPLGALSIGHDFYWRTDGFERRLTAEGVTEQDHDLDSHEGTLVRAVEIIEEEKRYTTLRKRDRHYTILAESERFGGGDDEMSLDLHVMLDEGKTYVGTEYREDGAKWIADEKAKETNLPHNETVRRGMRLRIFDEELKLLREKDLLAELAGAQVPHQYWGMGGCVLRHEGYLNVFAVAPVGDFESFSRGESRGTRHVFVLRYTDALEQVATFGPLSEPKLDAYWTTGCAYHRGRYFISYTYRRPEDGPVLGDPTWDDGHVGIDMYDDDFNLLQSLMVSSTSQVEMGDGKGAHRSSIFPDGDQIWVVYDQDGTVYVAQVKLSY